jgi:hypothetical protein
MVRILKNLKHESGYTRIEIPIAIAMPGSIAAIILGGLSMTSGAAYLYDEQDS